MIGEIGGHFGANLGTCELAVALHSLLDSPRDKILWDVGHQAYPHKILTGRRDRLSTIRQYEGLAPFCSIFESEHDIMGAGHASTSIGYAVGLKEAMRKGIGEDGKVVAVIGDGALTGGVAYEALHDAGGLQTPIVIVLNDNGMSISPNVGALSRYFNRVRLNPPPLPCARGGRGPPDQAAARPRQADRAARPRDQVGDQGLLGAGPAVRGARPRLRGRDRRPRRRRPARGARARPSRPTGPWSSTSTRSRARGSRRPRRAASRGWRSGTPRSRARSSTAAPAPKPKTVAGQGVRLARVDRARSASRSRRRRAPPPQYTQVFAEAIVAEARRDPRVIGITAAMAGGTGLQKLADEIPGQYYDVGIAEQNAVLLAAGLALQGAKPVCAIYSTFLQRAYDQIIHDVCPAEPRRHLRDGPGRPGRRRRPHPPRGLRRLLLRGRSPTSS